MNLDTLILHWTLEVSNKKKPGSRIGLITNIIQRAVKHNSLRYLFLFRLAQYLYSGNAMSRSYAKHLIKKINLKYGIDIGIDAQIDFGFRIAHLPGVVISGHARIGRNFLVRQNTTIGIKTLGLEHYLLAIGDNVSVGANSCIIGDHLVIGDDVTIGAMTLVNKSIESGSIFYNAR
ncbi:MULTISPECIES: serine acetyltransferase [unclassified Pseudomonas]|uniref:serine acetyltransferase n=1 Tax=unclassified Pseudomonas TaxID=196821 RepID=UPI0010329FA3|nr:MULTISPECIES: serine acetyltransferase [unclassified Pseudomonas]